MHNRLLLAACALAAATFGCSVAQASTTQSSASSTRTLLIQEAKNGADNAAGDRGGRGKGRGEGKGHADATQVSPLRLAKNGADDGKNHEAGEHAGGHEAGEHAGGHEAGEHAGGKGRGHDGANHR